MAAGDEPGTGEQQPEKRPRMPHSEYLSRLLFVVSGVNFTRAVVSQAAHYAEQVLPPEEDDEGERACLAAARAWSDHPTRENVQELERAADLISANGMEGIRMVDAARYAVRAALAETVLEAAEQATQTVEDAAGRKAARAEEDYMGRAIGRRAGLKIAQDWQVEAAMVLAHEDVYDDPLPPFPPLSPLPDDPQEVLNLFKTIYSEEDAYRSRDLTVLLDFMTAEQQLRFKRAAVSQAMRYAEPLLPPAAEDQGERALLDAARRWVDQPAEENTRAADLLPQETQYQTPPLQWTFTWAADTQRVPHATPAVAYVARAVQLALNRVPHEARMAAAELEQARARQWQTAAAEAIVQGSDPPEPSDMPHISTGARGAYLEGRLALLVRRMTEQQRVRFKQAVVRDAVEQAERVLPPEAEDRGHRRCLDAARRWLSDPTEENAKAAWAAAWVGTEGAPAYPTATQAESAAWLAARGAAEAAGEADVHRAALLANVLAPVTIALEGVTAAGKRAEEAAQRGKTWHIEVAWRVLLGEEPPQAEGASPLLGESFGTLVQEMDRDQLNVLAGALERQVRWYGEHAAGPPPTPWLGRPESGATPGVDIGTGLENHVRHALKVLSAARASGAESPVTALREAAESAWKAAMYAGERQAAEWQVEAAWAILHGAELPPLNADLVKSPPLDAGAAEPQSGADTHDGDRPTTEAAAGSGASGAPESAASSGGGTGMAGSGKSDRLALQELLSEDPEAQARYSKLKDFEKQMCFRWITDAPSPVLREQRICRLARRLWLTSFNPYYDIGPDLMLPELDELYGSPLPLHHVPPEELKLALEEQRVLGANHYRNFDDAGTWFRIIPPGERLNDDMIVVYARPCVLTENIISWLNRNGWETMREVREWFDLPEVDRPPDPPHPEPLRIEDSTAGELRPESERHTGPVLAMAIASAGGRAVSASADGTLRVWDAVKGVSLHTLTGHSGPVRAVVLTQDGRRAISASSDGTLLTWDVETGQLLSKMSGHQGEVYTLALMPDGRRVVSASEDGALCVWRLPPESGTVVLLGHTGPVLDVAVTPDGERVVSASADGTLRVWDVNTGQTLHVLARHTGAVTAVAITTEGDRAVSASTDGTLRVWNVAIGRMRAVMIGHSAEVSALETIPGEPRVLSASADGTLRLWHIVGPLSNTFAGHSGAITGMAVPRDGWGERLVYLSPGSLLLVTGLAAVGSNRGVVSASADGTIRLWEAVSGRCQAVLAAGVPFRCAAVAPDGHTFVAGDEQGQVHFLQLRTD